MPDCRLSTPARLSRIKPIPSPGGKKIDYNKDMPHFTHWRYIYLNTDRATAAGKQAKWNGARATLKKLISAGTNPASA